MQQRPPMPRQGLSQHQPPQQQQHPGGQPPPPAHNHPLPPSHPSHPQHKQWLSQGEQAAVYQVPPGHQGRDREQQLMMQQQLQHQQMEEHQQQGQRLRLTIPPGGGAGPYPGPSPGGLNQGQGAGPGSGQNGPTPGPSSSNQNTPIQRQAPPLPPPLPPQSQQQQPQPSNGPHPGNPPQQGPPPQQAGPGTRLPPGAIGLGRPPLPGGQVQVGPPPPPSAALQANLAVNGTGTITASQSVVGPALAKLTALSSALSAAIEKDPEDVDAVREVIAEYFTHTGVLKYGLWDEGNQMHKAFDIPCAAFPRYQHINSICGVLTSALIPSSVREYFLTTPHPTTYQPVHIGYLLKSEEATWYSRFSNGVKIDLKGSLTVHFVTTVNPLNPNQGLLKVESLDFNSRKYEEWIERNVVATERVEKVYDLSAALGASGASGSGGVPTEAISPTIGKGGKKANTRKKSVSAVPPKEEEEGGKEDFLAGWTKSPSVGTVTYENHHLPISPVGAFGITEMGMRCLEIAESVAQLQDLITYSIDSGVGPIQSLARFAENRQRNLTTQHPIASTSQNPSTNTFYSSVTVSPNLQPTSPNSGGVVGGTALKRKATGPPGPPPRTPTPGHQQPNGISGNANGIAEDEYGSGVHGSGGGGGGGANGGHAEMNGMGSPGKGRGAPLQQRGRGRGARGMG